METRLQMIERITELPQSFYTILGVVIFLNIGTIIGMVKSIIKDAADKAVMNERLTNIQSTLNSLKIDLTIEVRQQQKDLDAMFAKQRELERRING